MTLLKICGITNIEDRDLCLEAGVDLLGFNIYKGSARYVDDAKLSELLSSAITTSVIVGVDNDWIRIIKKYSPQYVQLHGNETIEMIKSIKDKFSKIIECPLPKVIKKVTLAHIYQFEDILSVADYLLCDVVSTFHGGTGKRFDWEKLENVASDIRKKMFVAGGINPDNIDDVLKYDIFGVDVATGSENLLGKKDKGKIKQLVQAVKEYNE